MWSLCLEGLIFFTSDASILIDICSFILTLSNLNSGNQKVLRCHTLLRRQSFSLFFISFLKVGQPRPLFVYFRSIQTQYYRKNVGFSGIRTRIFIVLCKHADHLTTTTVPLFFISLSILSRSLRFLSSLTLFLLWVPAPSLSTITFAHNHVHSFGIFWLQPNKNSMIEKAQIHH